MASNSRGFTLIELVTIIILLGAIAFVAAPRLNTSASTLQSARDDFVAGLFYAQQIAMARDSLANPITFVVVNNRTITVRENGVDLKVGSGFYPLTLPNAVTIAGPSSFPLTLDYNKLGATTATTFTLSAGGASASVAVSATGYAR